MKLRCPAERVAFVAHKPKGKAQKPQLQLQRAAQKCCKPSEWQLMANKLRRPPDADADADTWQLSLSCFPWANPQLPTCPRRQRA